MDVRRLLVELRSEREQIDRAIRALEQLASAPAKRRGRPPKCIAEAGPSSSGDDERVGQSFQPVLRDFPLHAVSPITSRQTED